MGNCRDCRFWKPYDPSAPTEGDCRKIVLSDQAEGDALAVMDVKSFEDIYGDFRTRSNFGCVQFQPKES